MSKHFNERFYREVDPDGELARTDPRELERRVEHARSRYFAGLAFKSVKARQAAARRRQAHDAAQRAQALEWLQHERGMCSRSDCEQPISGWCATCTTAGPFRAPKLCERHLSGHCHAAGHVAHWLYEQEGGAR
jgi:hypothetical protein